MRPVLAGFWKQRETFDGTYTFDDLMEINLALDVKEENERRARMAAKTVKR